MLEHASVVSVDLRATGVDAIYPDDSLQVTLT